jgi:hypothetical protein
MCHPAPMCRIQIREPCPGRIASPWWGSNQKISLRPTPSREAANRRLAPAPEASPVLEGGSTCAGARPTSVQAAGAIGERAQLAYTRETVDQPVDRRLDLGTQPLERRACADR